MSFKVSSHERKFFDTETRLHQHLLANKHKKMQPTQFFVRSAFNGLQGNLMVWLKILLYFVRLCPLSRVVGGDFEDYWTQDLLKF